MKTLKNISTVLAIALITLVSGCFDECKNIGRCKPATANVASVKSHAQNNIIANGLARYYTCDGVYVTSQCYGFNPENRTMKVESDEPDAIYVYQLGSLGTVRLAKGQKPLGINGQCIDLLNKETANLLYEIVVAASGLETLNLAPASEKNAVKIQGKWYFMTEKPLPENWASLKLYAHCDTELIDRVEISDCKSESAFSAYAYNFVYVPGLAKPVPSKIDIYANPATEYDLELIAQFEFVNITSN